MAEHKTLRQARGTERNLPQTIQINVGATAWMEHAACVGKNPEWWTTADHGRRVCLSNERWDALEDSGKNNVRALRTCSGCPVRAECLDFALEDKHARDHGIWGGTYPHEREAMILNGESVA